MQTAFLTDCVAVSARSETEERIDATVTLKFLDQNGKQVGTSVAGPAEVHQLGVQLTRLAADLALHAVSPNLIALPDRLLLALSREERVAEAA
ncbi:hypothetical protein [Sphingomonas sp. 3-13AW]|uniref:hypothetical protein n=1 Tax=Sphingomonas sp. 3-13AW TaxID=3050450 RepID=UPI003BB69ED1